MEVRVSTIDEEFSKARVKGFVRTRKGKMERVNPFERKDWGKRVEKVEPLRGHALGKGVIAQLPPLNVEDIRSVYVGIPDRCMCGCSGKYYYTKINQKESSKDRGYEVTNDEVDDSKVKRVMSKIRRNEGSGIEVLPYGKDGNIFTSVIGKTQYTIYTREDLKKPRK